MFHGVYEEPGGGKFGLVSASLVITPANQTIDFGPLLDKKLSQNPVPDPVFKSVFEVLR